MPPAKEWVNQVPLRIKTEVVETLSALSQFHRIPDETLIRIAKQRTRVQAADRWAAIRLLISNPCPIPVVHGKQQPPRRLGGLKTPAKLTLIPGGRRVR